MVQLLRWIDQSNVSVISACIDKIALTRRYAHPFDPYDLAIRFCLERTHQFLAVNNQIGRPTQVIFERSRTAMSVSPLLFVAGAKNLLKFRFESGESEQVFL